ncbi:hypothetical protein [uncultured Tenacibaculum sp.]|uniref:hypothetical protein n=1 Tax=uncultured Tenacibaculum sp. TaxID=174713 RepID=UPI00260228E1|nr:hypothetical protein [uncultured Tenacibaculum sp.]
MKKKIAIIAMLGASILCKAQTIEYPIKQESQKINNSPWYGLGQSNVIFRNTTYSAMQLAGYYGVLLKTGTGNFAFDYHGNLGIGTIAPEVKLQVQGSPANGIVGTEEIFKIGRSITSGASFQQAASFKLGRYAVPGGIYESFTRLDIALKGNTASSDYNTDVTVMTLQNNGNVGIGTTNPGIWKLAVNGAIRAKEIKVETGWSDFVFYDDYKLPTLEEVERHIKEKGHLKDIPSAKEVSEDGIFLGEMDSKLLQKIEELTLYTIEQEKKIKFLENQTKEIEELKKQNFKIEEQQKKIEKLETLVNRLLKNKK